MSTRVSFILVGFTKYFKINLSEGQPQMFDYV